MAAAPRILASTALAAVLTATAWGSANGHPFPEVIPLPPAWNAEGVASGPGTAVYAGSLATGAIWKGDLRTGVGSVLVPGGAGQSVAGLKCAGGLVFAAGAASGTLAVYDATTGAELVTDAVGGGFVNDVTVTNDAAWFTDSFRPVLYRLPLTAGRPAGPPQEVSLGAEWVQTAGFNANGIAATADGRVLLVINSTTGTLFRVDPATGDATAVLADTSLTAGDGILLRGHQLAVVRNTLNEIAVLRMSPDFSAATLVQTLTDPDFAVPTTVAAFGGTLYAVNAHFGETNPRGFEIVKVDGS